MNINAGVIGASNADFNEKKLAYEVGKLIAKSGYTLISGGLSGVMKEASRGAKDNGGLVLGILPGANKSDANEYVDIGIATNMGHARNFIIAHSADFLIAVGGCEGTLSEIAISLKLGKPVASLESYDIPGVQVVNTAKEALNYCLKSLNI